MFRVCRDDMNKFCPDLRPTSHKELFESECFKSHEDDLSAPCKKLMTEFRLNPQQPPTGQPWHSNPHPPPPPTPPHPTNSGGTSGSSNAQGTLLYESCHADRSRFCPEIADPFTESNLFEAKCFRDNLKNISPACKQVYEKFVLNRHFLVGVFISGSMMVMASGLLSLLALCCCVGCCVRLCMKRRSNRFQQIKAVSPDTELGAVKSINDDASELSQTQFVFPDNQQPPAAAFSPYSVPQQYMQPVFTVVQQ